MSSDFINIQPDAQCFVLCAPTQVGFQNMHMCSKEVADLRECCKKYNEVTRAGIRGLVTVLRRNAAAAAEPEGYGAVKGQCCHFSRVMTATALLD